MAVEARRRRVILNDENGENISSDNPLPVEFTSTYIFHNPASYTLNEGALTAGNIQSTYTNNQVYLQITEDVSTGISIDFEFTQPDTHVAEFVQFNGRYQGNAAHTCDVYAYNWGTTTWDKISTDANRINHSTSDYQRAWALASIYTDPDGNLSLKILHNVAVYNAGHNLYVDYISIYHSGSGATQIQDPDGTPVYQNIIQSYRIADEDSDSSPEYYGFIDKNGGWYILKVENDTYRYAVGSASYTTNWAGRAGLSYDYFDMVF